MNKVDILIKGINQELECCINKNDNKIYLDNIIKIPNEDLEDLGTRYNMWGTTDDCLDVNEHTEDLYSLSVNTDCPSLIFEKIIDDNKSDAEYIYAEEVGQFGGYAKYQNGYLVTHEIYHGLSAYCLYLFLKDMQLLKDAENYLDEFDGLEKSYLEEFQKQIDRFNPIFEEFI